MNSIVLLAPEIGLSIVALLLLVGEAFFGERRKLWVGMTVGSLLLVMGVFIGFFVNGTLPFADRFGLEVMQQNGMWVAYDPVLNMVAMDSLAMFFKIVIVAAVLIVVWMSIDYYEFEGIPFGTYASLLLLGTVGMLLLVGATDLLMAIIALELLGVTSFILTGFVFHRRSSSEAAIKIFLVGSLSTALFLFGVSFYYGFFGTTSIFPLIDLGLSGAPLNYGVALTLILLMAGLGFKLALVPFHMWAPDTYEGAPTPVTAFLSVAPKAAAIGFLVRLFGNHEGLHFTPVLAVFAALTMTVGNIGALPQTNLKRLMAYSSIAQMGYILLAVVAGSSLGIQAVLIYTFIYVFMNMGVFAVLITVSNVTKSDELSSFEGLSKRSLWLSVSMVVCMLSLTGIPPLAGFIGKFVILAGVMARPELLWLAILAILNSVVSLFYYFKVVHQMFFREAADITAFKVSPALMSCLVVTIGLTLAVGLLPDQLLGWVRNLIGS